MDEAGTLGRAEPFVTVARVEVGTELSEVERHLRGRVRAIHDRH